MAESGRYFTNYVGTSKEGSCREYCSSPSCNQSVADVVSHVSSSHEHPADGRVAGDCVPEFAAGANEHLV